MVAGCPLKPGGGEGEDLGGSRKISLEAGESLWLVYNR